MTLTTPQARAFSRQFAFEMVTHVFVATDRVQEFAVLWKRFSGLRSHFRSVFGFYTKIVQFSGLVSVAAFGLVSFQHLVFRVSAIFILDKFGPESENISDFSTFIYLQ